MNQDIYAFAKYYFNIFRNPKASNFQVEEGFAEKCFSLGFEMDCGKSFTKKYPDAFRTAEELDKNCPRFVALKTRDIKTTKQVLLNK